MRPNDNGTGSNPGPDLLVLLIALLPVIAALLNYYAATLPLVVGL